MHSQRGITLWTLFLVLLQTISSTDGFADELNRDLQVIPAAVEAPTIDGNLNDPAWQNVKPFSPFLLAGAHYEQFGPHPRRQTVYPLTDL